MCKVLGLTDFRIYKYSCVGASQEETMSEHQKATLLPIIPACAYMYIYIYMHVYIYIYMFTYMYIYIYVHIRMSRGQAPLRGNPLSLGDTTL